MAIVDRLLQAVGLARLTEQVMPTQLTGGGIDPDEHLYRSLTGSQRDISPLTQDRVLQLAGYLYETNPLARRICELTKDFVVGDGFTVSSPVPEIHAVLTQFWTDPITNLHATQHLKALELGLYGEQIWPVFVNEVTGHVRLGVIDPLNVAAVLHDPDNRNIPIGVLMKKSLVSEPITYRVIYPAPDTDLFSADTQRLRAGYDGGECFYFAVNKLTGQSRGRSDLLSLIDWLDGYDRYLFDTMERSALINAFVWDVKLMGAKQPEIDAWLAKNGAPPKPGTVRAHNEGEEWNAVTADLKHQDVSEGARLLRNHVLGGSGIPEHWFSEANSVNRASAAEMGTPVFRRLLTRQNVVKEMFAAVCRYQITRAIEPIPGRRGPLAGFEQVTIEKKPEPVHATEAFSLQASNVSSKDLQTAGTILLTVSQAVNLAVMNKLMKPETAVKLLAAAANELGVDVNPQEELATDATAGLAESEVQRLYREIQAHIGRLREYSEDQPRVKAGSPEGGQFASKSESSSRSKSLFHGTSVAAAENIAKTGLQISYTNGGAIWGASKEADAHGYAAGKVAYIHAEATAGYIAQGKEIPPVPKEYAVVEFKASGGQVDPSRHKDWKYFESDISSNNIKSIKVYSYTTKENRYGDTVLASKTLVRTITPESHSRITETVSKKDTRETYFSLLMWNAKNGGFEIVTPTK